jgi:hypothetical protein
MGRRQMIDYSTIDVSRLKRYPAYKLPRTYKLQKNPGSGCFMDPPGYPTYFTRSVYTQYGNSPWRGPQMVITYNGQHYVLDSLPDYSRDARPKVKSWDEKHAQFQKRLRGLWLSLPIDHLRTRAWIAKCCGYFQHCYDDPRIGGNKHKIKIGSWSTQQVMDIAPLLGLDVPMELWDLEDYSAVYSDPNKIEPFADLCARVENLTYRPWTYIRQWYPEYDPQVHGCNPGYGKEGDWWERWDHKPSPDECPGKPWARHGEYDTCQFCGMGRG